MTNRSHHAVFTGNIHRNQVEKEYKGSFTETINPTENEVYVHDSLFNNCQSDACGGAICCTGTSTSGVSKLVVSQSSFTSCTASKNNSGAIYLYNTDTGQCIICKVCSFQCKSALNGQFACTTLKNDINYINQVNDTTITGSKGKSKSYFALYLCNGKISLPSVNITNNECAYYSALYCHPYQKSGKTLSDVTCFISYTSIVNNTATQYRCIYLDSASSSQCICTCNIINNDQEFGALSMLDTWAQVFIKSSCILGNNKGKQLLCEQDSACKIILTNCTIDDDLISNERYVGALVIESTIKSSFINGLTHFEINQCDSYPDSYGSLTAAIRPIVHVVGII